MAEITGITEVQADVPAQKVAIAEQKPRPVQSRQEQTSDPSVPARTTFQEDLTTAGQRVINLKWETTQQVIAISVTLFVLSVCSYAVVSNTAGLAQAGFIFLTNIAFLIIGTYFQRTNHTKTGGVGMNDITR